MSDTQPPTGEIQTCTNWQGDGLALHEMLGATRHRWHCFDCGEKGPAEVDGVVCKAQLRHHYAEDCPGGVGVSEKEQEQP